ncbi:MAG TPA: HAMP domain-containing sensor histidine kinase [Gemmatimonadaceae bacterium]|jgi:two-component system sensor histidine kinase EvgS
MSLSKSSTRIGIFALLLSVIVLSLFGSLAAADRALASADREAIHLDAHGAALVAERELRLKAGALTELFEPLLPSTAAAASRRDSTLPPGFDAVWVLDTKGSVVWQRALGPALIDTTTLAAAARDVTPETAPRVHAVARQSDSIRGGILLAMPLIHRGQRLGSAVGYVAGARILGVLQDGAVARPWIALRAAGRPIAALGHRDTRDAALRATSSVRLPGDPLEVEVAHAQTGRALRTTLWMLGVIALAALLAGLARERRQSIHLAGRTAELERLYQEVARSNRMKSEFLANVSHELRTPLNAIVGFVEMLRESVYGELTPRQALPVDRIAASATHLRHLVDRLLDIAKIAAGRLEVHTEPLVLRPFVLNVASEMESLVSERGLALSIGVGPSLPRIRTDQTHLRQILINLIGNAVKYTPSGGINVRAKLIGDGSSPSAGDESEPNIGRPPDPQKRWVALQVTDTGVGIATADLGRIFDEFEQVNAGARTDSARRGTGLGLAISRRLARLIGGDLTVVSEVGRGSTFTVWLPLDVAEKRQD